VEDRSSPHIVDLSMLLDQDSILALPVIIRAKQPLPCHPSTTRIILGEPMGPSHIRIRPLRFTLTLLTLIITRLPYRHLFPPELASHKDFHRPLDIAFLQVPCATVGPYQLEGHPHLSHMSTPGRTQLEPGRTHRQHRLH
jgi:hypothetical protein